MIPISSYNTVRELADRVRSNVGKVIVGKDELIDKLFIALVTAGHVLLDDVPGTGKTLLAKSLAKSVDCSFKRVQFTPDLLPSDLSGIYYFNQKVSDFEFRPGPLFTHILLADEINRATPRTQSSLLECMEERQISIDGVTHPLENPFLVIATQNPLEQQGTFPLPEAQLDRFLFKLSMGYPSADESVQILKRFKEETPLEQLKAAATIPELLDAREIAAKVYISDDVLKYIVDLAERTRKDDSIAMGVSPRGCQALLKAVQVQAVLEGRNFVTPDDIKYLAPYTWAHRILLKGTTRIRGGAGASEAVIDRILQETSVPTEEVVSP
ncbi:AAA family ATPase [Paenibacillus dakarensis]|uniref:AAA family ATPase n=1 Tax=Paenibacillus dakarensis TaxID=1527293 RepID=UPI0006D56732|nr:MoxR family ATPase [Paenibacillus dakarensis]